MKFALLTDNPRVKSKIQGQGLHQTITVVGDCSTLEAAMQSEQFTGVIIDEPTSQSFHDLSTLNGHLNLTKTFVYAGPLPAWRSLKHIRQILEDQPGEEPDTDPKDANLASYVEKKIGDFVRAMNVGSGKNLYPTLMRAVERPLIELALRETNGNQLKAARLLGLNRNTLRKKISDFQISVRRVKESTTGKRRKL
jgi:DNA-binding protein Fis